MASGVGAKTVGALRSLQSGANPRRMTWQQTMLRIRSPEKSLRFYRDVMGMTHIDTYVFEEWGFSLYFLESMSAEGRRAYEAEVPEGPGSDAAHAYLWKMPGVALELTHNHGSEEEYHAGNQERDGFGHIAFACDDVVAASEKLEKEFGVDFKKRPHEGRMKTIGEDGHHMLISTLPCAALPCATRDAFSLSLTA